MIIKKTVPTTATIYVDTNNSEVLNRKGFEALIAERAAEFESDTDRMAEWLEYTKRLNAGDVFYLDAEERAKLEAEWKEECAEDAEDDLLDEWNVEEVEVEVEVEIEV